MQVARPSGSGRGTRCAGVGGRGADQLGAGRAPTWPTPAPGKFMDETLARLRRRASRNQHRLRPEMLECPKHVIVFTTFPGNRVRRRGGSALVPSALAGGARVRALSSRWPGRAICRSATPTAPGRARTHVRDLERRLPLPRRPAAETSTTNFWTTFRFFRNQVSAHGPAAWATRLAICEPLSRNTGVFGDRPPRWLAMRSVAAIRASLGAAEKWPSAAAAIPSLSMMLLAPGGPRVYTQRHRPEWRH